MTASAATAVRQAGERGYRRFNDEMTRFIIKICDQAEAAAISIK